MTALAPVLAIGELLWDLLPTGPRLGGAPFNAVARLSSLGHPAAIITAVGADDLGDRARVAAADTGVAETGIQVARELPTGTVGVHLDPAGVPTYVIHTPAAYQVLDPEQALRTAVDHHPHAIILGTLAQQAPSVRDATRSIVDALPDALVVYDANLREGQWTPALVAELLAAAHVVRCSEDELGAIDESPEGLLERYDLRAVVVTRGAAGAVAWSRDGRRVEVPARRVVVRDTVGAGDAFTAGVTHGLLAGASLPEALDHGARVAADGLAGATSRPVSGDER